jgi:hypothetical protein
MKPAYKRIRVVALLGLLVMTTTMAASPVRDAVLPLLSRPLARLNIITAPAPLVAGDIGRAAPGGLPADVGLTPLSPPNYVAERSTISHPANPFVTETALGPRAGALAQAWADETLAASLIAQSRASRFDVGPWQSGSASSPARAGSASLRRARAFAFSRAQRRNARDWFADRDDRDGRGGRGNSNGNANGSGSASSGSGSAGSAPTDPSGVLDEHTQGVPQLNGSSGVNQAGTLPLGGLAVVASTPEPSTLLLFGTGILAAGGALRRRLSRSR